MQKQENGISSPQKEDATDKQVSSDTPASFWLNLLCSGTYPDKSLEQCRRIMSLNGVILAGTMFLILFGIHAFVSGYQTIAAVDLGAIAVFLSTALLLRITHNYIVSAGIAITALGLLLLYFIIYGGVDNAGYLWAFAFPLVAIFLLGKKAGTLATFMFLGVVILFFVKGLPLGSAEYSLSIKYRFIGSFISISFIAFFSEYVNNLFENRIQEKNEKLRKANEEMETAAKLLDGSEKTLQSLIERSSESIIVLQDERIKFINSQLSHLGGYNIEEMIGKPFIDYVHPDERKELRANYLLRIHGVSIPETYQSVLLRENGDPLNVEIRGGRILMKGTPADLVFIRGLEAPA